MNDNNKHNHHVHIIVRFGSAYMHNAIICSFIIFSTLHKLLYSNIWFDHSAQPSHCIIFIQFFQFYSCKTLLQSDVQNLVYEWNQLTRLGNWKMRKFFSLFIHLIILVWLDFCHRSFFKFLNDWEEVPSHIQRVNNYDETYLCSLCDIKTD